MACRVFATHLYYHPDVHTSLLLFRAQTVDQMVSDLILSCLMAESLFLSFETVAPQVQEVPLAELEQVFRKTQRLAYDSSTTGDQRYLLPTPPGQMEGAAEGMRSIGQADQSSSSLNHSMA
jgi:hypothetical protein